MSPIIVRMNTASSHTSTVLFIPFTSGESHLHERTQVEQRFERYVLVENSDVVHFIHYNPGNTRPTLDEENACRRRARRHSVFRHCRIEHGDDRSAKIYQAEHFTRRAGKRRHGLERNYFTHRAESGAVDVTTETEDQHPRLTRWRRAMAVGLDSL